MPAASEPGRPTRAALVLLALAFVLASARPGASTASAADTPPAPPKHVLSADRFWLLDLPGGRRLDASGLMRLPEGDFVTVNDQDASAYRFAVSETNQAVSLTRVPDLLPPEQATALAKGSPLRLDIEGISRDAQGRWYLCEESRRWILRWDPATKKLERLEIDWTPVRSFFHSSDFNASFEGVTVGGDRLYVANERQTGRLIVVDLATLRIVDHFTVAPAGSDSPDTHYSDLCWADGSLWALLRDVRKVLRIDPASHAVQAEFEYGDMENAPETGYGLLFAPGFMEGLWVDDRYFWLLTDNNGFSRRGRPSDHRPTLYRCVRPDRPPAAPAKPEAH